MAYVCYIAAGDRPGFIAQTGEGAVEASFPDRVAALGLTFAEVPLPSLLGVDPSTIYIATGDVTPRPVLPIYLSRTQIKADGKRLATITGLPTPTTVLINGEPHLIADGRLDLISDMPAVYQLAIDQWPYLPWSATVTAT